MRLSHVVVVVALVGCKREKQKEPRFDGPMPVAFGDCAGPGTTWVSGPRPLPFELEEANRVSKQDAPATAAKQPEDDPPPPEDGEGTQGGAFASLTGTGDISSGFDDTNIYGGLLGNEAGEMNGGFGFGRSGFGPGGGGTGWGTIGTGRYGTIGHGSGTSTGHSRHTQDFPEVSIGQPNAQGDLDKAIIRRYIKRNISKITYCYEKQLLVKPKLAGTVQTQFFITANGTVSQASGSGVDPEVASCVASVIKDIEFPKPKGGGGVQVNYPFTFRPAGDAVTDAPPTGTRSTDVGPADVPPAVAPPQPPPPAETPRQLFRSNRMDMPANYKPGSNNPLRAQEAALVECLRKGTTHFGAIVVDLTYDASGKATDANPYGVSDERARKCLIEAAKKVTHPGTAAERCSLSYGEMPLSALPSVDITVDAITFGGKQVAGMKSIMAEASTSARIPELADAVSAKSKQAIAASAPPVALHGPVVVKPLDATPMKIVWRVAMSVVSGGDDVVLASQHGGTWTLLSPISLPVVPVPLSTGAPWNQLKISSRSSPNYVEEEEHVVLSVLVTKDKVWVGLSRVNEFTEFDRGPDLDKKLLDHLKQEKQSAFFADRTDIEIAGDDDVTYGDVLQTLHTINTAGFTDWRLSHPLRLAARPDLQ